MNFENARAAIYGRLTTAWNASHSTVPVLYENRLEVDLATRKDPFITCEIVYNDGQQVGIGAPVGARYSGAIWLSVWQPEHSGVTPGTTWLGELATLFKAVTFGGVNTRVPIPVPGRSQKGWDAHTLRVPFWFDDFS